MLDIFSVALSPAADSSTQPQRQHALLSPMPKCKGYLICAVHQYKSSNPLSNGRCPGCPVRQSYHATPYLMADAPDVLFAKLRVQTRAELSRMHHQLGATMVYVTHDQEEAMTLGDQIAVMNQGFLEQFDLLSPFPSSLDRPSFLWIGHAIRNQKRKEFSFHRVAHAPGRHARGGVMKHHTWPGLLGIGLLVVGFAVAAEDKKGESKKQETVEGKIMKVDPSGHRLTVLLKETNKKPDPPQRQFPLDRATKFIFFAGTVKKVVRRQQAYKDVQFKEGAQVAVVSDETGKVLEVRIGSPSKESREKIDK